MESGIFRGDIRSAAKHADDSLRSSRAAVWMRARSRLTFRALMSPVRVVAAEVGERAEPAVYALRRAASFALRHTAIAAQSAGYAVRDVALSVGIRAKSSSVGRVGRIQAAMLMCVACVVIFVYGFYGIGLEVSIDGQPAGYVRSESQFDKSLKRVNARVSELLGMPYMMDPNVEYKFSLVSRSKVYDSEEVENLLFARVPELTYLHVLTIDGKNIVASADRTVIENALQEKISEYAGYDDPAFVNTLAVNWQMAPLDLEMSPDQIDSRLSAQLRPSEYVVSREATVAAAAKRLGMTSESLRALNPEISDGNINGYRLRLNYSTPLLSVRAYKTEMYNETVPFETEEVEDPDAYRGRTNVLVEGAPGEVRVTASVEYVNGREVGREIIKSETILAPVTELVAVGTAEPPTFVRPTYGKLTSGFHMRYLFGENKMHTGIDLAAPMGSPVVASCAGTVIRADWYESYGLCVIIDHGHGIKTLYGHNSKLLVEVGQVVKQSQQIALMGSTGRSTGPHCHFEIRINDKPVDPMKYLK